jgi:hypothetical protein
MGNVIVTNCFNCNEHTAYCFIEAIFYKAPLCLKCKNNKIIKTKNNKFEIKQHFKI